MDAGPRDHRMWRSRFMRAIVLLPFFLWGFFSLWWGGYAQWVGVISSVAYAVFLWGMIIKAPVGRILLSGFVLFLFPLALFFLAQPSNQRNWQPDVARTPFAVINGDAVILHNVRNFEYRTGSAYTPRFETRTYDLSRLRSVDLILTDWGLTYIAHTMVSFGFEGGEYLCFSIETRKETGESYSALKGFFRQYELIYIAGDERDLIRLRTNFRNGEDVYLYRLRAASIQKVREFLLAYLHRINALHEHPQWYNALTQNCMTSAFRLARANSPPARSRLHWSTILNGLADRHAYHNGTIDTSLPFDELKRLSRVNDSALAASGVVDFSEQIRAGLPGMDWIIGKGE